MLDQNLPTFFLKYSADRLKHHRHFYLSEQGNDPEPFYDLRQLDPSDPKAKNCYAVALFDSYNPESLFGEVLIKPGWTQPSLSQDEIRRNGGLAPPPQPVLPGEFTIHLYNPDQDIVVTQKPGSWGGSATYEFSLPQNTFRLPSSSDLDRQTTDPGMDSLTPRINFAWRRDGKLSKDLTCFMTGKNTDTAPKKKSKRDPDIAVALFRQLREMTVYESNLYRLDMEDPKGLEVVLLLSATVMKDLYFGIIREAFNVDNQIRKNSGGILTRKNSPPTTSKPTAPPISRPPVVNVPPPTSSATPVQAQNIPPNTTTGRPRVDSAAQVKASEAEAKRQRKQADIEAKERRKKAAEVDKETERLRRKYGVQSQQQAAAQITSKHHQSSSALRPPPSHASQQRHSAPLPQAPFAAVPNPVIRPTTSSRPHTGGGSRPHFSGGPVAAPAMPPRPQQSHANLRPSAGLLSPAEGKKLKSPKKSFWHLRSESDNQIKLKTKKSSFL